MTELSFKELIEKPILDSIGNGEEAQFRQMMVQVVNSLTSFTLFLNPVAEEFPELAEQYLAKIKYPISLKEIKEKLQPKNMKYQKLGEVFRDLVLLLENCREFNSLNENILLAAAEFQAVLEESLNDFCRKVNAETFSYDFLKQSIFDNDFVPFEVPKEAKMLDVNDFIDFQQNFNALSMEKEGRALNMLINELDDYEGGNCILEFSLDNHKEFWWFYGVIEQLLAEKAEESDGEEEDIETGETTISESTTIKDDMRLPVGEV